MHRRTSHGNRLGLSIIGLLLTIAGAAIIATHLGAFGRRAANENVYPQPAGDWLTDHRWLYWIAAAIAVILAIFALRWLLVQFRTDPVHRLSIDTERNDHPGAGVTSLTGTAVLNAIGRDAERIIGVRNATSALSGHRDAPELWLTVTIDENADSGAIRTQLFDDVLRDARTALEKPNVPGYLNLKVSNNAPLARSGKYAARHYFLGRRRGRRAASAYASSSSRQRVGEVPGAATVQARVLSVAVAVGSDARRAR